MLWHADSASKRLRKQPHLRQLILAARPPGEEPRDARDVATVVRRADRTALSEIGPAIENAIHDDVLEAPALVVDGLLTLAFDHIEALRALVAVARAVEKPAERLARAIESAEAVTKGPLADAAWALAEPEMAKLHDALVASIRAEAARALDDAVERKLTIDRKLLEVTVLGEKHFVAHLTDTDGTSGPPGSGVTVYVPLAAADRWPLVRRLAVRLVAEAHAPFDDREPGPSALVAIALYRRLRRAASA